jgi:hypothetical protein
MEARLGELRETHAGEAERANADRAEVESMKAAQASERERLEAQLTTLETRLRGAEAARDAAVNANADRKTLSRWHRLRAAWRGE